MSDAGMGAANVASTPTATAPVVANGTLGNESGRSADPKGGKSVAAPQQTEKKPARPKFSSTSDEQLWRAAGGRDEDYASEPAADEDPVEKGVREAGKSAADDLREREAAAEREKTEQAAKKKYRVGEDEFELTPEQADRFAQKGIYWEKRANQVVQAERNINAAMAQLQQQQQQVQQTLEALKAGDLTLLDQILGPDKAREAAEQYLRPKIERELMDPHDRARLEAEERAARAEAALRQREEGEQKQRFEQETQEKEKHWADVIMKALESEGLPRTDYTAAEMADIIERSLEQGVRPTPEAVAKEVARTNTVRVKALVGAHVKAIQAAMKAGDERTVIAAGEHLAGLLGEEVMFAVSRYHLARARSHQPSVPKSVVDAPKVKTAPEPPKKRYMSEDEYREARRARIAAMERGEDVSETW